MFGASREWFPIALGSGPDGRYRDPPTCHALSDGTPPSCNEREIKSRRFTLALKSAGGRPSLPPQ
jgi:hypothetical protein